MAVSGTDPFSRGAGNTEDQTLRVAMAGNSPGVGAVGTPAASALSVQGVAYHPAIAITRPANTTPYTAGDVIGVADPNTPANAGSAILALALAGPAGGSVVIIGADLRIDLAAVPSGMTGFRIHLYDTSPAAILDNAAFDLVSGDRGKYLGFVDVGATIDNGSTLWAQADGLSKLIKLAAGSTTLYAELQTLGGYTPTSGEIYNLRLHTVAT